MNQDTRLKISVLLLIAAIFGMFIQNLYYSILIMALLLLNLGFQFRWYTKEKKLLDYKSSLLDLEIEEHIRNLKDIFQDVVEMENE